MATKPGWIQNGSKRDAFKAAMLVSDWLAVANAIDQLHDVPR